MNLLTVLTWVSSLAFIYFGVTCFYSKFIISEFKRYGLPKFRKLTGFLQLLGAIGLLIGLYFTPILLLLASTGLHLLMLSGFIVRIKIKDNFIKSAPAFIFSAINLCIAIKTFSTYF
ncbi:MAG: DoxX family protein [Polaribacter sp.]|nr:DoxX family protein [Polaribacter sp.]